MVVADKQLEILLIEDDRGSCVLTGLALKRSTIDHHLTVTHNGIDALKLLKRQPPYEDVPRPDLILLDLRLPGLNGFELLDQFRQDLDLADIAVVVLTFSSYEDDMKKSYDLHANGYITKPVDASQFEKLIPTLLAQKNV